VTICIAAISKDRERGTDVIVTASDRMVTINGQTEYIWTDQTKTFFFSSRIMALSAGNPDLCLELYRHSVAALRGRDELDKVANKLAQKFREHRARRNERRILSPHCLTFDTLAANERTIRT
jgi:hypothetical protein